MRSLLILGAGIYQLPLIRKAAQMGLRTIVASRRGNYPGFAAADEILDVDTTDAEAIYRAACDLKVDAIMTTGTDVAVRSIGYACERLGLPGISEKAARILTDKALMKEAMLKGGVNTTGYRTANTLEEAKAAAEDIGYPVMVKACDVSGSRGVSRAEEPEGLEEAFLLARKATGKDYVVVEGAADGIEIGVDGYVLGGELVLFAPHRKFVERLGQTTVPSGHAFPLELDSRTFAEVKRQLELCIAATGADECAVNGDFMLMPDGSVDVIEVGGRCGATCIPELISINTGIDYYAQMINGAMGEEVEMRPLQDLPCMAKLLFSSRDAEVCAIDRVGLEALSADGKAEIALDVCEGDLVHEARNGTDRWGQVILQGADEELLDRLIEQVKGCVSFRVC